MTIEKRDILKRKKIVPQHRWNYEQIRLIGEDTIYGDYCKAKEREL